MSDPRLLMVADIHGLAGRDGELRALLDGLAVGAHGEDGCLSFRVLAGAEPGAHVLLAAYRDEAALRAHYDTPHYRWYRERVGELQASPSDVVLHHVSTTVHARDPGPPDPGLLG
jgi:quinol monooxygenase YgiN